MPAPFHRRQGFTLIEILVAVSVLVVIVLICGQAFEAASGVARTGEASGDALQEAWLIQSQMEEDLSSISSDGALVIHSVEVPNDYNFKNWSGDGVRPGLIHPNLPASAPVRCDQLVFFKSGFEQTRKLGDTAFDQMTGVPRVMGGASMITYGHALQFPELSDYSIEAPSVEEVEDSLLGELPPQYRSHDIDFKANRYARQDLQSRIGPFYQWNVSDQGDWGGDGARLTTKYTVNGFSLGGNQLYSQSDGPEIRGNQPDATRWLLARQAVAMGDDDGDQPGGNDYPTDASKRIYRNQAFAAETLFPADPRRRSSQDAGFDLVVPVIDNGRVDIASMNMGAIREILLHSRSYDNPDNTFARRPWFGNDNPDGTHAVLEDVRSGSQPPEGNDGALPGQGTQQDLLKSLAMWPRAERHPHGVNRYDQGLTSHVLSTGCSSFIVEWTWDDDVAETRTWQRVNPSIADGRLNEVTWPGMRFDPAGVSDTDLESLGIDALPSGRHIWFGMPSMTDGDDVDPDAPGQNDPPQFDRRVMSFSTFANRFPGLNQPYGTPDWQFPDVDKPDLAAPSLVHPGAIDGVVADFGEPGETVREYWAVFGPNRRWPLLEDVDQMTGGGNPDGQSFGTADGTDDPDPSYTPWPTALRITVVLHGPGGDLENGKEVQFVVELPRDRLE
ncbi:MAG: prepilin-type N-terminal cleavage/methylation domain-containing protein [Phycisphaerales bacterium]|nr:prepilin-type N-terminal cleavage/methylation domain-containing protein [Phycisphaerales bacterium]